MGCSNPHAHGQVWNTSIVPEEPQMEFDSLKKYKDEKNRDLLVDYVNLEMSKNERIVYQNASFLVVVPYWAVWPFETMIVSKERVSSIKKLTKEQVQHLADAISVITKSTTSSSTPLSPTQWVFINHLWTLRTVPTSIFGSCSTLLFCDLPPSRSSRSDSRCWECRSETLLPKGLPSGCMICNISI